MKAVVILSGVVARAKPRPRAGKFSVYMPKSYLNWCESIGRLAKEQLRRQGWESVKSGPVKLTIEFHQRRPRGDGDQLIGAMMDALQNDVAFHDDCQVWAPLPLVYVNPKNSILVTVEVLETWPAGVVEWVEFAMIQQAGARRGRESQKNRKKPHPGASHGHSGRYVFKRGTGPKSISEVLNQIRDGGRGMPIRFGRATPRTCKTR